MCAGTNGAARSELGFVRNASNTFLKRIVPRGRRNSAPTLKGIPNEVSSDSSQQDYQPKRQLDAHPHLPSAEAPCLRKNVGPGDEENVQAEKFRYGTQNTVHRCNRVISSPEMLRKTRPDLRVKGRPHHRRNHRKIQDQHGGLAGSMRRVTLAAG